MEQAGFHLRVTDPENFVARTRVLPFIHVHSKLPLDVVLAGPGIEESFIQRAVPVDIEGTVVPVVSPEDLIVMKILAGRTKDLEDVRGVLAERLNTLDLAHIRTMLEMLEQALGQADLLPVIESELVRARRLRGSM